jgi:hypothetical protein
LSYPNTPGKFCLRHVKPAELSEPTSHCRPVDRALHFWLS